MGVGGVCARPRVSAHLRSNSSPTRWDSYRERLAVLNERLASEDRLLTEYRTKLTEARTQIEKLTTALADAEKSIRAAKDISTSVQIRSRDPLSLYEDNNRIAQVQDPNVELDLKKITFSAVNSGAIGHQQSV